MHPTRALHDRWAAANGARARSRVTGLTAVSLALALTLLGGADAAQASSLTTSVSPDARAGTPMTVSAQGTADEPATLRVFVQQGDGGGCAGGGAGAANAEAQSARPGSTEVITQQPSGPFAYSAPYTPPAAGSYALCAYLFGSTAATGASQVSASFSVAPAPPPPAATTQLTPPLTQPTAPGATGTAAPKRCVVPKLKGRTYLGARKLIRRAGCSVGTVYRPDRRTKRIQAARGRVLRVVSQFPRPGTVRQAKARLMLRLAYVTPRRSTH